MPRALPAAALAAAIAASGCTTTNVAEPSRADPPVTERLERIERDLATLRTQFDSMRPSMERLVRMEDDIRALLERLSTVPGASRPAPASAPPLPVAPEPGKGTQPAHTPTARPRAAVDPLDPTRSVHAHALHLASYREPRQVSEGWRRLRARFPDQLGTLAPRIVGIDFGDGRGTFYRLKAGPLPDASTAEALCRHIRGRGEFCGVTDFTGTPGEEFWGTS